MFSSFSLGTKLAWIVPNDEQHLLNRTLKFAWKAIKKAVLQIWNHNHERYIYKVESTQGFLHISKWQDDDQNDYDAASRIQAGFRGYLERKKMTGNQASLNKIGHKYSWPLYILCTSCSVDTTSQSVVSKQIFSEI